MIDRSDLFLIYRPEVGVDNNFNLIHFFSTADFIPRDYLVKMSQGNEQLRFSSLGELYNFSLNVGTHLEAQAVYVLSVDDYNLGMEGVHDRQSFIQMFAKNGEKIENTERTPDKSSIFGKIFGRGGR